MFLHLFVFLEMSIQQLSESIPNQNVFTNYGEVGAVAVIAFNQKGRTLSNE